MSELPFWQWFEQCAQDVEKRHLQGDGVWLDRELGGRVAALTPPNAKARIGWEIGPGSSKPLQLALSPVVRENFGATREIVKSAPALERWEFFASKPPKTNMQWAIDLPVTTGRRRFEFADWSYQLAVYPDGVLDVTLIVPDQDLADASASTRNTLAQLVVEAIIGEQSVIESCAHIAAVTQTEFAKPVPRSRLQFLSQHLARLTASEQLPRPTPCNADPPGG